MNGKKYCPIHCFNYNGMKCPICEQERVDRMVKHYIKPENKKNKQEFYCENLTIEKMDEALLKLQEHFNNR